MIFLFVCLFYSYCYKQLYLLQLTRTEIQKQQMIDYILVYAYINYIILNANVQNTNKYAFDLFFFVWLCFHRTPTSKTSPITTEMNAVSFSILYTDIYNNRRPRPETTQQQQQQKPTRVNANGSKIQRQTHTHRDKTADRTPWGFRCSVSRSPFID